MSKYKVGDKVFLEAEIMHIDNDNPYPYFIKIAKTCDLCFAERELISKTYEDGLNDAWELARKVNSMSEDEFDKCFNFDWQCTTDFTYQEILAMVEAYEESKAIEVGNVVECFNDYKGVVLDSINEQIYVFTENGCVECLVTNDVKKTNKHLDIEHLLEQIRGNE